MPLPCEYPAWRIDEVALIRDQILQGALTDSCVSACNIENMICRRSVQSIISTKCWGYHSGSYSQAGSPLTPYKQASTEVLLVSW
jgi:hypothetical protein